MARGRPIIDLKGKRFGRLTVLSLAPEHTHGMARWLCRCDCTRETVVRGGNLRNGNTKSCGHCGLYQRKIRDDKHEYVRAATYGMQRRQIHDRIAALRDRVDEIRTTAYPQLVSDTNDAITHLMAAYRAMLWDDFIRSRENCDRAEACIENIMHGDTQQQQHERAPLDAMVGINK